MATSEGWSEWTCSVVVAEVEVFVVLIGVNVDDATAHETIDQQGFQVAPVGAKTKPGASDLGADVFDFDPVDGALLGIAVPVDRQAVFALVVIHVLLGVHADENAVVPVIDVKGHLVLLPLLAVVIVAHEFDEIREFDRLGGIGPEQLSDPLGDLRIRFLR